ncbi:MAG: outer membrane lipoprotein-sorting protein [Gammaproteobacteria bacterium]|nr:outer membrane lipoprotein-sorting protein [Gammaproteobacteria bacterium]
MRFSKVTHTLAALVTLSISTMATAAVDRNLAYPSGDLTADQIIDQVFYVNHFYGFDNYGITKKGKKITVLVNKSAGEKPSTITVERYLNNDYDDDPTIKGRDLAIFRSGKLRGTGMLVTDFDEPGKSQSYAIWIPSLRKIRRFAEPAQDDAWGGTDFTFGDVVLRKPENETHTLMGKDTFSGCLGSITLKDDEKNRYTRELPAESCVADGKSVYKVKSTTKFDNWWYDERISYIDTASFADYRTEYFKDGTKVKVIDRDWQSVGDNPRQIVWGYWYGKTFATGHETWAVIPKEVVTYNDKTLKPKLWTERTLRKIKR